MATLIRLVPWIAALVPVLVLWPTVVGLIAALVWIAVIAAFRVGARGQDRTSRAGLDLVLLTCCVGAFFFGGLYFAPAAAAFWLLDREAPDLASGQATIRAPTHPPSRYLGLISGVLGMGGVGAFLLLPTHTTASSTLTPPNVSTVTGRNALQIGLDAQAIVAITLIGVFFALVAIGSVITAPRRRLRRTLLGCGVLGVVPGHAPRRIHYRNSHRTGTPARLRNVHRFGGRAGTGDASVMVTLGDGRGLGVSEALAARPRSGRLKCWI